MKMTVKKTAKTTATTTAITTMLVGGTLLFSAALSAAEVNLQWHEPEEFRDIEANSLASQKAFQQRVIDELGRDIRDSANEFLAEGQQLNMTVTDIDLAGDVDYFFTRFNQGIRVVKDLYFPAIEFSYELLNAQGDVIMSGEENVKDMGFRFSGTQRVNNAPFDYEERMINDWFRETFADTD